MNDYKAIIIRFAVLLTLALVAAKKIVTFDATGITAAVTLNK